MTAKPCREDCAFVISLVEEHKTREQPVKCRVPRGREAQRTQSPGALGRSIGRKMFSHRMTSLEPEVDLVPQGSFLKTLFERRILGNSSGIGVVDDAGVDCFPGAKLQHHSRTHSGESTEINQLRVYTGEDLKPGGILGVVCLLAEGNLLVCPGGSR